MRLLDGESVIMESNNGTVALTTHRVAIDSSGTFRARYFSISLDAVASCEVVARAYPYWLVLAVVLTVVGVVALLAGNGNGLLGLLGGALCVGLWAFTRRVLIEIRSTGGSPLRISAAGVARDGAMGFIHAVEKARFIFVRSLGRT